MNTLTDLLLGVGQPRVSHFPDLCTLLYTYLSTLDYWTKTVYYLFTQTSPVAHTSALTPTYIKSQKLPNWPISKELGLGRMLLPHWKLLLSIGSSGINSSEILMEIQTFWFKKMHLEMLSAKMVAILSKLQCVIVDYLYPTHWEELR